MPSKAPEALDIVVIETQFLRRVTDLDDARTSKAAAERALKCGERCGPSLIAWWSDASSPGLKWHALTVELRGKAESAELAIARLERAVSEVKERKEAYVNTARGEASAEVSKTYAQLRPLQKALPAIADRLRRTDLNAPMRGIVNRLLVSKVGGVVKPVDPIVEIVPAEDQLVVQARVRLAGIGFLKIGQKARVKLAAYAYSIFGSMGEWPRRSPRTR